MLTQEEEQRIIGQVLSGDTDAFELLVLDQSKIVYNLALRMVGNEEDAADISQEAFLKAYTNLSAFRGDSKFSSWLYKLTTNLCLDFIRKRNRHQTVPLVYDDEEGGEVTVEIPDESFSPETEVERRELQAYVREGLSELSPLHREILLLREIGGMSYGEIGEQLQLEEGTVKSRIFRARKKLCEIILKKGNISERAASKHQKKGGVDVYEL